MPGTLKFPSSLPFLCHPYKYQPPWHRATTTTPATTGRIDLPSPPPRRWWLSRITPPAPSAHISRNIHIPFFGSNRNRSRVILGFPRREFLRYFSSEEEGRCLNSVNCSNNSSNTSGITTHMGPTYSSDEDQDKNYRDGKKPPPPSPSNSAKFLTLPTILTIGRVAAVPLLVSTFYVDSWWGPNVTTGVFIAAAITDWLDGYIARKMKLGTAFGAFLDPVADKLMVAATLILLCSRPLEVGVFGQAPWLFTVPSIAIIGREITMSAVREWAASQDGRLSEAVAVNNLGKWKTATQMTALTILLASRDSSLIGAGSLVASGVVLLYISAWLSVWSLVVYMRKIWKVLSI